MNRKALVAKYRWAVSIACRAHNLRNLFRRTIKGSGNRIQAPCALLKKVHFDISGSNNTVIIGDFCTLKDCTIYIHGSNNVIEISPWSTLIQAELGVSDSNGAIRIGQRTRILGKTQLSVIEGTTITIGEDCLFSSDIHFRTGDSHSILDKEGRRINASRDIRIGNHVWVGTKVTCLKGAEVADHSIVGACAVVTKAFDRSHCVLAGFPAKIVKEDVDWSIRRIPVGETAADFQPF